jgi:16S rRNA (uracil1498-N3)-methyltransferase
LRLLVPPADIQRRQGIVLPSDKSHYLLKVLRAGKGDRFIVIDGRGRSYPAEVTDIIRQGPPAQASSQGGPALLAVIDIIGEPTAHAEGSCGVVLCQGLLKGEKMDLVVQKVTELGVTEIKLLVTERCIVRHTRKVPRWRKIAEEAAEQCGRAAIPAVREPQDLTAFLATRGSHPGIIFWEEGGKPLSEAMAQMNAPLPFSHATDPAARPGRTCPQIEIIVGPEGGLSTSEVIEAESRGFVPVTLGSLTLRAETAAIVGVALTQYIMDYGQP